MPAHHLEVEVKLERDGALRPDDVPAALALDGRWQVARPVEHALVAQYFDTADLRLARAAISLRRRVGGPDEGWHLKLPAGADAKHEVHRPLSASTRTVPAALRRVVAVRTDGADLVPVARIRTSRITVAVLDGDREVAELALDQVAGERLAAGPHEPRTLAWQEVEVELVDGDRSELAALVGFLHELGLRPASHASKLAHVLDVEPSEPGTRWPAGHLRRSSPSVMVAMAYLDDQVEQLRRTDPLVRADADEAVHDLRVAVRRLRSALRTWRPVVDDGTADALEVDLSWLCDLLGAARDAEVLSEQLVHELVRDETQVAGRAVLRDTERLLVADRRQAHADLLAELSTPRYRALVQALTAFVDDPPLRPSAHRPVEDVGPRRMRQADRVVRRRMTQALANAAGTERDHLLHQARKAAKRARYAAESLEPVYGKGARRYARAMEGLQARLGDHQDTVVLRQRLAELADDASGTAAFAFGRQHALDAARGQDTERAAERAWRKADDDALRAWFV